MPSMLAKVPTTTSSDVTVMLTVARRPVKKKASDSPSKMLLACYVTQDGLRNCIVVAAATYVFDDLYVSKRSL